MNSQFSLDALGSAFTDRSRLCWLRFLSNIVCMASLLFGLLLGEVGFGVRFLVPYIGTLHSFAKFHFLMYNIEKINIDF